MTVDLINKQYIFNVNIDSNGNQTVNADIVSKQLIVSVDVFKGGKGDKGDKGDKGEDGQDGTNGVDGTDGQDGQDGQDLTLSDFIVAPEASTLNDTDRLLIEQGGVWKGISKTNLIANIPDATQSVRGLVNIGTQTFKGNKTIVGEHSTVGYALVVKNSLLTSLFKVGNNGNVGIGSANETNKLTVQVATAYDGIVLNNSSGINIFKAAYDPVGGGYIRVHTNIGALSTLIPATGVSYFNGGNVAIGATTALAKLDVNGNMAIRGLGTAIPAQHILYYTDNGDGTGTIKIKL